MKRVQYSFIFVLSIIVLVGCSSTSPLDLDNQLWLGTATRQGNPDTFVRLTFNQEGKNVTGTLELGQTEDTIEPVEPLTGVLEGRSLEMNNLANDTLIFGDFDGDGTTFSGTLRFTVEGENDDFTLTMTYQQEIASTQ
jgi:hypothetical protein